MSFIETDNFKNAFKDKIITDEQKDIFSIVQKGIGNVCIKAVAGSGKSTVAQGCIYLLPDNVTILVLAHNKTVAKELKNALIKGNKDMKNVKVMTFHSYGYRLLESTKIIDFHKAKRTEDSNSPNDKYAKYIRENIDIISDGIFNTLTKGQKTKYKNNIKSLVEYAQLNLKQSYNEVQDLAFNYGITLISNEIDCVLKVLEWGKSEGITEFSYPDYLWLPNELNFKTPNYLKFDYIFVDEAQDMSPAQQELIKKAVHRTSRIIMMGDDYQAINMWCGAELGAMDKLKKRFPSSLWHDMTLSVNYRCGKHIISYVNAVNMKNNLNFYIQPFHNSSNGDIKFGGHLTDVKNGDLILSRMTAPLIELFLKFKKEGKTVVVKGEGIEAYLRDFLVENKFNSIEEIYIDSCRNFIDILNKTMAQFNCDENEAIKVKSVSDAYQFIQIIDAVRKLALTKDDFITLINDSLSNIDNGNCITLSTIHRAKGAEANDVYIICPSTIPSPFMDENLPQDVQEEKNLEYVALTRAKQNLIFVDERDIRFPIDKKKRNNFKDEINKIKEIIK